MALSNSEVAQNIATFLKKYFSYNAQTETLNFDLADFNNNIQPYLAALRTDFMLAVSGDYDGVEDYTLNSAAELTAAANTIITPVNEACYNLFGFNISELLGDDSALRQVLTAYIYQWRTGGVDDPINALVTKLNSILSSASDQTALTNVINQSLVIPFVRARGIQTTAALATDINNSLALLPALDNALTDSAKANIAQVVGTVLSTIQSQLGNINHLNLAITGTRLDYNATVSSIYFGNLSGDESLFGGGSNDVALLGAGDTVNSGAGNDIIIITDGTATINSGYIVNSTSGVQYATVVGSTFEDNHSRQYIGLSTSSTATVIGFEAGTLDSSDAIYLVDGVLDDLTVQFGSNAVTINNGGGSLTLAKDDSAVLPSVSGSATTTSTLNLGDLLIINDQAVHITDEGRVEADDIVTDSTANDSIAAEAAKAALLAYNPEARVYSAEDIASLLAADVDNDFWNGDMFVELPSLPADEYIEGNDDIHTGKKVTFINKAVNVDQHFNDEGGNAAIVGSEAVGLITLTAGNGGDSLMNYSSAATVSMYGGTGNDYIYNTNGTQVTVSGDGGVDTIDGETGVVLAVAEGTIGTVVGFKTTDTLCFVDGEPNKAVEMTSEGLSFWTDTVMGGSDYLKLTLPDITETTRLNLKYGTNPTITEVFIADGDTYEVTNGAADEYVGAVATPNQALSFRGVTDDVNVVLDGSGSVGEIWNINTALGGDGDTTLWGSAGRSDRLIAGTGRTALFGGWGDIGDSLVGSNSASKVDGTAFVVVGNCGSDTLSNFAYGTEDTSDILLTFGAGVSAVSVRGGDVVAAIGGDSEAVFEGGVNKLIRINDGGKDWVVECGEALTYDSDVNCYGSNSATTLTIDDSAGDRVEVYGDASDGKIYHNVATVDGGGHSGTSVLVGNELGNVLKASRGGSTLWGGVGTEADTLIGGVGTDTFIYRRGNGDDVLKSVEEGDIINLLDITLEDITASNPDFFTTRLNFSGGGSLTVASLNDLSFRLSDGNTVKASALTSRK